MPHDCTGRRLGARVLGGSERERGPPLSRTYVLIDFEGFLSDPYDRVHVSRTFLAILAFVIVITGVVAGVSSADGSVAQSPEGVVVARDGELFAVALASGAEVRLTTTRA